MAEQQYDMAAGFQTLVKSNEAIASEITALRQTLTASIDMAARFAEPGSGASHGHAATNAPNTGQASPTAGQTTSTGGGPVTFETVRQGAMGLAMGAAFRAAGIPQPTTGTFGPGGRFGGAPAGGAGGQGGNAGGPAGGGGGHGGGGPAPAAGGPAGGGAPPMPPSGGGGGGGGGARPAGGAFGEAALKYIPGVSMVAGGIASMREQADKDNYYRNVEGGTHGNAVGERLREEGYTFGSSMVFDSGEARQAYKGVTRIGYTNRSDQRDGTSRSEALNYVYEGKKSRGQSVDEGLMQLEVASRSLSTSLGTLNTSMENVTESAGKAGVNTEMARKQMLTFMNAGIARGQGAGASGFAEAIVSNNVSYGRDYAARANSGAMYSPEMQYRASSMSGMTQGALANQTRNDPAGALGVYQKVIDQSTNQAGVTPEMKSWIKTKVDAVGGADGLKNQPMLAEQIANDFLDNFGATMDQNAFANVMSNLSGTDFGGDPLLAAKFLVQQTGGNNIAAEAKKNQMQVGLTDSKGKMADGTKNAGVSSSLDKFDELTHTARSDSYIGRSYQSDAAKSYKGGAEKSGKRDPVIEALLQNEDVEGVRGNKTKVEVQAKSGPRVMSLEDAIKEFPNQVAAGKVRIVDGDAKGKDISDLTGGKVDATRDWRSEVGKDTKTGQSTKDFEAEQAKKDKGSGQGSVTRIELTPGAQKLVRIMDTGSGAGAAAAGEPPAFDLSGSPVGR